MEKVNRGQIREVQVDIGGCQMKSNPMSRIVGDQNMMGYTKLSHDSSMSSPRVRSTYRQSRANANKPSRPLVFTIFGWCFSIIATFLILFVLFLLAYLLYETIVKENMKNVKVNKRIVSTTIHSLMPTEVENGEFMNQNY